MNRRPPLDRRADLLSRRLEQAARIIPTIPAHLAEQRRLIHPIRGRGDGPGNGGHSDPTGRTVDELAELDRLEGHIDDGLAVINTAINQLERDCATAFGTRHRPADDEPKCYIAGCDQIVDYNVLQDGTISYRMGGELAGLCPTHRVAVWRANRKADAQ